MAFFDACVESVSTGHLANPPYFTLYDPKRNFYLSLDEERIDRVFLR